MAKKIYKKTKGRTLVYVIVFLLILLGFYFFSQIDPFDDRNNRLNQNESGFYYYTYEKQTDYFYTANGLSGNELKQKLNSIINENFKSLNYQEAKTHLAYTDLSIKAPKKIYNIYDGEIVVATQLGYAWEVEHVWANKRLGIPAVSDGQKNRATDLHNLRAVTPEVKQNRIGCFYSEGSGDAHNTHDKGFYPGESHRGDVARILLYMAVMYPDLTLTDDINCIMDNQNDFLPEGAKMGKMALLLKWHREDPVDRFEKNRNEKIFEVQGNRNPFIDKPEYAHLIWENKEINELLKPSQLIGLLSPINMTQMIIEARTVALINEKLLSK